MEKRGQGALEYLLLIGGAVLIAVIVIAVVTGLANTSGQTVTAGAQCATLQGCDGCRLAAVGVCAGFNSTNVRIFTSNGTTCSADPEILDSTFSYCKAA